MLLAGISDRQQLLNAEAILLPMGEYFQVQDDWLDVSAAPEVIGKIGTDIKDNKCSWVVCTALQQATPEQRTILNVSLHVSLRVRHI